MVRAITMAALLMSAQLISGMTTANAQIANPFKAIQKLVEEVAAPRAAVRVIAQPAQDPFGPKEKEARENRLKELGGTYLVWVDEICELTDEQEKKLTELVTKLATAAPPELNAQQQQQAQIFRYLPESSPILFNAATGPAGKFLTDLKKEISQEKILTDDQKIVLEDAVQNRAQWRHRCYSDELINLVDDQLYFTPAQREKISADFAEQKPLRTHALYAFHNYNYYIPYEPATQQLKHFEKHLTASQEKRLDDLEQINPSSHITFNGADGIDQWYVTLDEETNRQQEKFRAAIDVRVSFYQSQNEIPQPDQRTLQVAGKGTTQKILSQWRETTLQTLRQYEDMQRQNNQNFSFGLQYPEVQNLEADPLWTHTIEKLMLKDVGQQRAKMIQDADLEYLLAILDDELWLSKDQLDPIRELLRNKKVADDPSGYARSYYYSKELLRFARIVHLLNEEEVRPILNPQQMAVWDRIKGYFRVQGNYVTMQSRHGDLQIGSIK